MASVVVVLHYSQFVDSLMEPSEEYEIVVAAELASCTVDNSNYSEDGHWDIVVEGVTSYFRVHWVIPSYSLALLARYYSAGTECPIIDPDFATSVAYTLLDWD